MRTLLLLLSVTPGIEAESGTVCCWNKYLNGVFIDPYYDIKSAIIHLYLSYIWDKKNGLEKHKKKYKLNLLFDVTFPITHIISTSFVIKLTIVGKSFTVYDINMRTKTKQWNTFILTLAQTGRLSLQPLWTCALQSENKHTQTVQSVLNPQACIHQFRVIFHLFSSKSR